MADPNAGVMLNTIIPGVKTGQIFYVNSSGYGPDGMATPSDAADGLSPLTPMATIAAAMDKCSDYAGDTIIVMPGYTQTVTTPLLIDVIGVTVIGVGSGTYTPKITVNGAVDCVSITAAGATLDNFDLRIITTDAATALLNIDAAGVTVRNIKGIGSVGAVNVVDCVTVTANASDLLIDGVMLWNSVVAVNSFLSLEGAASRVQIRNFRAFGDCATAGIIDAAKVDYLWLENVTVATVGTSIPAATLDSNPEGCAVNCCFAGTHTTLATNAALGNLMRIFLTRVTEETDGSKQGAFIPAEDAD